MWDKYTIAQRLYLNVELAEAMLSDLCLAGISEEIPNSQGKFIYVQASKDIHGLLDQLANYYSYNLIEVTHMIHSKTNTGQRVQQFADAFKFNKDK